MANRVSMFGVAPVCFVWLMLAGAFELTPASGGITVSGDLSPTYTSADPWTIVDANLVVGDTADGSMQVTGGSSVSNLGAWLANGAGTFGEVTITGTGSLWSNVDFLVAGNYGDAELTIADGGQVTSLDGGIGIRPGSTGIVTVTDAGSSWDITDDLVVGLWGQGDVEITNSGLVTSEDGFVGGYNVYLVPDEANEVGYEPNGVGRVRVSGAGSSLEIEDSLYVGYAGDANMVVSSGGQVSDDYGLMGYDEEAEGEATVSGVGSRWANTSGLGVGIFGGANLVVEDGAQVTSLESGIALGIDSVATVEVTGTDSLWSNTEELGVGISGMGTLTISNGGRVTNTDAYVGGLDPEAPEVSVALLGGTTLSGTGLVEVDGSGSQWDNSGFLYVGYTGTGTLNISDGGLVTSEYGGIGTDPNGIGTVTIADADSQWRVTEGLAVGGYGQGDLTITGGGSVDANEVYVGGFDGAAFGGDANDVSTGSGIVTVTGTDSELVVSDGLYAGYSGDGTLVVRNGGTVQSGAGYIGYQADSTGQVTVTGAGSIWTPTELDVGYVGAGTLDVNDGGGVDTDRLWVGAYDTGTLSISDGGVVDSDIVWIGVAQNVGFGAATVTGSSSLWDANDTYVGLWGQGELTVSAGGHMISENALIGSYWSSTGAATVTGSGSLWEVEDDLTVGFDGIGSLVVSDGGQVTSDRGMIAWDPSNNTSTVTVTGTGSLWDIDTGLYVGGNATTAGGIAVLDVNDGGAVTAGEAIIWGNGTLSGDGTLTAPTVANYGTIAPGNSIGTLTIDGDVTMDANSVLAVEVDNSDNSDLLHVTGDVEIQGGTVQVSSEETIRGTHEYTILDANSITGTFDTLDTALVRAAALTSELDYDTTVVTLQLTALGFDVGDTRNQRSLGVGLQEIALGGGNAITTLLQTVPTDEELLAHYDELGGQSRPSLAPITVAGTSRFLGAVANRLRHPSSTSVASVFGTGPSHPAGSASASGNGISYDINTNGYNFAVGNGTPYLSDRKWAFWGKGFGLFGSRDDDVEAPGYDYTTYGLSVGLDYQMTETWLLGLTTGYSDGDVDYDRVNDSTDLSSTHFGLYGSWDVKSLYLDTLLTYTDLDYETRRRVELTDERLEGDFGGYAISGYFETGFDWRYIQGWLLQPLASFQFSYLDLDRYTESGGDAALGYDDQSYESYKGSLGVKVSKDLLADEADKSLMAQFRTRWLHEFGDTYSSVDTHFASDPTTVFAIRDEDMARDSAVLGVGLGAQLNWNTRLYADYDVRLNADDTAHFVSAGLRYQW